jgi:hypothetical protein
MANIKGVNLVLDIGANYLIGQTQASLELPENINELAKKEDQEWGATQQGQKAFNVTGGTILQDNTSENPVGANGVVTLSLNGTDLLGLNSLEATFGNGFTERGDLEDSLWRKITVSEKNLDISASGFYQDPNTTDGSGLDEVLTAKENGNTISFTLDVDDLTFSGDLRPGDLTIDAPERGDDVEVDIDFQHDGVITLNSGSLDTGQDAILNAWFDETLVTANMEHISGDPVGSNPVDGSTEYEGDTLVEEVTLSAERAEPLEMEFDLAGDGSLNRTVYSAA